MTCGERGFGERVEEGGGGEIERDAEITEPSTCGERGFGERVEGGGGEGEIEREGETRKSQSRRLVGREDSGNVWNLGGGGGGDRERGRDAEITEPSTCGERGFGERVEGGGGGEIEREGETHRDRERGRGGEREEGGRERGREGGEEKEREEGRMDRGREEREREREGGIHVFWGVFFIISLLYPSFLSPGDTKLNVLDQDWPVIILCSREPCIPQNPFSVFLSAQTYSMNRKINV